MILFGGVIGVKYRRPKGHYPVTPIAKETSISQTNLMKDGRHIPIQQVDVGAGDKTRRSCHVHVRVQITYQLCNRSERFHSKSLQYVAYPLPNPVQ